MLKGCEFKKKYMTEARRGANMRGYYTYHIYLIILMHSILLYIINMFMI